jgi:hypothetical protein
MRILSLANIDFEAGWPPRMSRPLAVKGGGACPSVFSIPGFHFTLAIEFRFYRLNVTSPRGPHTSALEGGASAHARNHCSNNQEISGE